MWYKEGMSTFTHAARDASPFDPEATMDRVRRALSRLVLSRFVLTIIALAAMLLPTSHARAQGDEFEQMAVVFNPLTRRSVDAAKYALDLDADQLQLVKDLYVGYRSAMKNSIKELEAKSKALMEKASENGDWQSVQKQQMKVAREMFDKVGTLETRFSDDLKAILTQAQLEKYPAYERARRRENVRLIQIMAGEAADVIDILRTLKIDTETNAELKAAVAEYDLAFDRVASERLTLLKEFIGKITSDEGASEKMMEFVADYMPRVYAKAKSGRDLNRETARKILTLLTAADQERFQAEVNSRSFPQVYRTTATGKKFDAAQKFGDLTDAQKSGLETLLKAYTHDVDSANKAWADAISASQEEFGGDVKKQMMGDESPAGKRASEAHTKRVELEKQYADRLEKLMNKEQADRLPAARPEDEIDEVDANEPNFDKDAIKDWKDEAE